MWLHLICVLQPINDANHFTIQSLTFPYSQSAAAHNPLPLFIIAVAVLIILIVIVVGVIILVVVFRAKKRN